MTDMDLDTLCECGHSLGMHSLKALTVGGKRKDVCCAYGFYKNKALWDCSCTAFKEKKNDELLQHPEGNPGDGAP